MAQEQSERKARVRYSTSGRVRQVVSMSWSGCLIQVNAPNKSGPAQNLEVQPQEQQQQQQEPNDPWSVDPARITGWQLFCVASKEVVKGGCYACVCMRVCVCDG